MTGKCLTSEYVGLIFLLISIQVKLMPFNWLEILGGLICYVGFFILFTEEIRLFCTVS